MANRLFLAVLAGLAALPTVLAQSASRLPAPVAGQYRCTVNTWKVSMPWLINRKYDVWSNSFYLDFAPTAANSVDIQPSPLGVLKLDGKGNYTQLDSGGKVIGQGTYSYNQQQNRPTFKGPLADNTTFKLESYSVKSSGEFALAFGFGKQPHVCFTKVSGNPLPQKDRANGPLTGRIVIAASKDMEYNLVTGQQEWMRNNGADVRLPGGLTAYTEFDVVHDSGQVVFASASGQALGKTPTLALNGPYLALNADGSRFLVNVGIRGEITPDNPFGAMVKDDVWQLYNSRGQALALTQATYLSEGLYAEAVPAFLPDGRVLIPNKAEGRTYLYSPDLQQARPFAAGWMPAVSPNGQRLAFLRSANLVVLTDAQGQEVGRLSVPQGVEFKAMTFSPDSQYLAFVLRTGPINTYLAYAAVKDRTLNWLENRSGEAIRLPTDIGNSLRMSWWTGQSALPAGWKTGATSQGAATGAGQPNNSKAPSTGSAAAPWPSWLPQGQVTITGNPDLSGTGKLSLTKRNQLPDATEIQGTLDQMNAAYRVYTNNNRVLLFAAPQDMYACLITQTAANQLSGKLYTVLQPSGQPVPTDGQCSIKP